MIRSVSRTTKTSGPRYLRATLDEAAARGATAESVGAPAAFDLRNAGGVNYTTPVKDQGGCGSCVAFGVVGAMEHVTRFMRGAPNLDVDLSEAHLFYCHGRNAGARCNTGWWPDQAYTAARDVAGRVFPMVGAVAGRVSMVGPSLVGVIAGGSRRWWALWCREPSLGAVIRPG